MSCPGKVIKYIYFKIHVWTFLDFGNQSKREWSPESLTFFDGPSSNVFLTNRRWLPKVGGGGATGVTPDHALWPRPRVSEKGVARASFASGDAN